jgi:hypothetical protein
MMMQNNKNTIKLLGRVRLVGLPLFLILFAWLAWVIYGDVYMIHARPIRAQSPIANEIDYGSRTPLSEYLSVVNRRKMFKASALYRTKKTEVKNVLGDLVYLGSSERGGVVRAFIQNTKTEQYSSYSQGENIDDLTILEIRKDRVIFRHGSEEVALLR